MDCMVLWGVRVRDIQGWVQVGGNGEGRGCGWWLWDKNVFGGCGLVLRCGVGCREGTEGLHTEGIQGSPEAES